MGVTGVIGMSGLDTVCPKPSYLDSELAVGVGVTPALLTALSIEGLVALKAQIL